jgi:hypothetical protein
MSEATHSRIKRVSQNLYQHLCRDGLSEYIDKVFVSIQHGQNVYSVSSDNKVDKLDKLDDRETIRISVSVFTSDTQNIDTLKQRISEAYSSIDWISEREMPCFNPQDSGLMFQHSEQITFHKEE